MRSSSARSASRAASGRSRWIPSDNRYSELMPQNYGALEKVLRFGEGRRLKRLAEQAAYVATLEPDFEELSDADLAGKTDEFKQRLENGEQLDELVFEAFAAVREAAKRALGMRHFDVQVMGGIALHEGDIAEMKTGEGKTFVAVQPLYLNSLTGQNVHLVTVNDYLAKRDAQWVGPVYELLGLRAGYIQNLMPFAERKEAYAADVTYGTNSEFGFDYLRDNMATSLEATVQRGHGYAIVDEVDSILIDEARTPLIISGEPETAARTYYDFARIVRTLKGVPAKFVPKGMPKPEDDADYEYDEKFKTVSPRETAIETVERSLSIDNLYDPRNAQLVNHLIQALKAQSLYQRDVDYVIQDGEVKIVDEFTGRIMEGRRWSEGLHQAVEAKEGVAIQEEHVTLATITLQNYFRLYEKLAGMTGTAKTEEKEFVEIYGLSVVEIPTNVPVERADNNDYIFKTMDAKWNAVVDDIKERHEKGQPVLVGTIAVETSEHLSERLKRKGVPHNVLNAKEHAREAEIIKDAGEKHAVTIATNMAGRGVDIKLGEGVVDLGGLYGVMDRFKVPEDQPMEAGILSRQIEGAQKKVEEQNFVARKNVLKYDDVMNKQRVVIYEQRRRVLEGQDLSEDVKAWIDEVVERAVTAFTPEEYSEEWDLEALARAMDDLYGTEITADELREDYGTGITREMLVEDFQTDAQERYESKQEEFGEELLRELERFVILNVVDTRWREHLENMDYLREGVHLRAMAQKDPLVEYTSEGHAMFEELNAAIREEVVLQLFHMQVTIEDAEQLQAAQEAQAVNGNLSYQHDSVAGAQAIGAAAAAASELLGDGDGAGVPGGEPVAVQRVVSEREKLGRNDPCWCGSGKKFKKCHGA